MTHRPNLFKKSPIALGIAALLTGSVFATQAAEFEFGKVTLNIDSTFTIGTAYRVEDRDLSLIGNSNLPDFNWSGYTAMGNVIYPSADVWAIADGKGGYSTNGDLGNLMHDAGDMFSFQISSSHELDFQYENMGVFMRGLYYKDIVTSASNNQWERPIGGDSIDLCASKKSREQLCEDLRLLDFFFYADLEVNDMPLTLRIGDQVVSWGESTFIQHGINTTNPVDVTRARTPGAELKEVFIPVGMVYASLGITDNVSLAGYYQYDWQKSRLPVAGSYFATNDFAGEGGQASNVQLGFSGNPDIHLDFLLSELNSLGDMLRAGTPGSALSQAYLAYPTKVAVRGFGDDAHTDASDSGQYGLKLSWYVPELNDTEFGFYHMNYHSTRPIVSGVTSDFTAAGIGGDLAYLAGNQITRDNVTELAAFTKAAFIYPEDIALYGVSFNTNIGETAFAGEISYRQDEPLQIDDVELLYMAMPEQLANAGLRPDLAGISQLNNITLPNGQSGTTGPGEYAAGYLLSDTFQAQMTVSHIFGPALGTDNLVLLGEVAYVDVLDFMDPNIIRYNSPGTGRTPSLEPNTITGSTGEGLHVGLSNGPETNPFSTQTSWGYRLLAVADYNNILGGVNLRARATFAHDVSGTTPDPLFLFLEDRKSASVVMTFDYLSKYAVSASYNAFWGGIGTTNALSDRDFVSLNFKYSY
ncbi:DUF1302 domain-containing protein [Glaciecola sp.]|nr:DUF1302 domain-containing protein [Glaciecola sp.]